MPDSPSHRVIYDCNVTDLVDSLSNHVVNYVTLSRCVADEMRCWGFDDVNLQVNLIICGAVERYKTTNSLHIRLAQFYEKEELKALILDGVISRERALAIMRDQKEKYNDIMKLLDKLTRSLQSKARSIFSNHRTRIHMARVQELRTNLSFSFEAPTQRNDRDVVDSTHATPLLLPSQFEGYFDRVRKTIDQYNAIYEGCCCGLFSPPRKISEDAWCIDELTRNVNRTDMADAMKALSLQRTIAAYQRHRPQNNRLMNILNKHTLQQPQPAPPLSNLSL